MYYPKEVYRSSKAMQKRLNLDYIYIANNLQDTYRTFETLANKESLSIFKSKLKDNYFIVKKGTKDHSIFMDKFILQNQ